MRTHRWSAIAFGGVMTTGQVADTALLRQMRLGFRDLSGDEHIRTGGNGSLEIGLSPTRAQRDPPHRALCIAGKCHRATQEQFDVSGHVCHGGPWALADEPKGLLTKTTFRPVRHHHTQAVSKLSVVAQPGMRVQRQVIGQQVDVVGQQPGQALLHPACHSPILTAPEKAVVHQDGIGTGSDRCINQGQTGGHAGNQATYLCLALHLQTIGSVVSKK